MKKEDIDSLQLEKFGYHQQLNRTMGGFSSFAISFSLISVLTGIFANFNYGFAQVGGMVVWSWLLVGIGQFLVALVMADLSKHFPISGYGYQWVSRLVNPHIGFFVGWFLIVQFITGFPGTSQAMAGTLSAMLGGETYGWNVSLMTLGIISLVTIIHLSGIKWASIINNLGVYVELVGVFLLILALALIWILAGAVDTNNLFLAANALKGHSVGITSFSLSLLLGAWCLTGFEAAADLAEETKSPGKNVPRAVILSQVSAVVGGFLIIVFLVLSAGDITQTQQKENALLFILENTLGTRITAALGIFVIISIFACAVASMATASRLIFSMARDNMLPFGEKIAKVNYSKKTPQSATLLIWFLSSLIVVGFRRIEIITSVGAVAAYIGYSGIMFSTIYTSKGYLDKKWNGLRVLALIWTILVVAALSIPKTDIPGISFKHLPAASSVIAGIIGFIVYWFFLKNKIKKGEAGPKSNF
ncbi:MAG: hypothetical protein RJA52_948 [Bacteroidota bacterium]